MVPARAGPGVEEGQLGVGVDDGERPEEPLGVSVLAEDLFALAPGREAGERAALALDLVDRPRLLPALRDGEDEAAVQQLLVHLGRGRREKDRHRPLDPVLLGHEPAGLRVLPRRGDRQLAFGLEELQGIGGPLGALLLGHREHLVREVRLAHVEEALAGHRRVGDALLLGHQGQHRVQQRGLARGRGGLDDRRQRLVELPRGREVAGELVGLLAHHAAAGEVGEDAPRQILRGRAPAPSRSSSGSAGPRLLRRQRRPDSRSWSSSSLQWSWPRSFLTTPP